MVVVVIFFSIYLSVYLQAAKRRYAATPPQLFILTTSKTQQFCETSSIFEFDSVKNEAILRYFPFFEVDNIKNEAILRDFRTRCFSEPIFRTPGATNHWKKLRESRLFYLFAHLHLLSSHAFSSLIFSLLLFSSLTVPTSAFPSLHIVGSLTSKLPSVNI